jgi:hypothetical protein
MPYGYDSEQWLNVNIYVQQGYALNAPALAIRAALCAGTGETAFPGFRTNECNSSKHCGTWQLNTDWQKQHDWRDVPFWTAHAYLHGFYGYGGLVKIATDHPDWTAGHVAQACQGAGPTFQAAASYYQTFRDRANWLMGLIPRHPGSSSSAPATPPTIIPVAGGPPVSDYDPSPLIRDGSWWIGSRGEIAQDNAATIKANIDGVGYCTTDGPHR